ncbi:MAG: Extracellular solute-binding protein family 1 [Chthoniobacteraceae bacterium]|nr:Extracellular solute-binding protein family 1 [Chthoniobacteraceae bacterium]
MRSHYYVPVALAAGLLIFWGLFWRSGPQTLVVYCAHDSIYSESILREFERQSGIPVAIRFDTEATKSLGLVELLVKEKDAPRCDLFWNNELLGTLRLADCGLLEPYKGSGYARIPGGFKDPDGRWTGFAARLRVCIFNTDAVEKPDGMQSTPGDLSRWAIAKPLYGTTLTHYSVLWQKWGPEKTKAWHQQWRVGGVRELNGNAAVKDAVAAGVCVAGFTDTDDFFEARDEGKPVAMRPLRLEGGETICIPNTVGLIHGSRRMADARKLADFLLSANTELALARSRSRQIPLGTLPPETLLPQEVLELKHWAESAIPLNKLGAAHAECLAWLKSEYLR